MLLKILAEAYNNFRNDNRNRAVSLYHKDIGFPENLELPRGFTPVMDLRYSQHAIDASRDDQYGAMRLPRRIDVRKGEMIEIEVTGRLITKMVVRFSYNEELDIVMVVNPSDGFVRTVWFNKKTDKHATLNRAKYATPEPVQPQQRR